MLCDDPVVQAFRGLGYNVVKYPSTTYEPLLLLESDGRRAVSVVGPLVAELGTDDAPPRIFTGEPAPDIGLKSTRKFSGKVAADVLQPLLAALGVGATLSATVTRTTSASVSLRGVTRDRIIMGDLARHLEGDIQPGSRHVEEVAARGRLFVVTSVLRSATLSTVVDASVVREVGLSATLPGAVNVSVAPVGSDEGSCMLSFIGPVALAFAFQAVRLVYDAGEYMDFATARGLSGYELPATDGDLAEGLMLLDDPLVEFAAPTDHA
jgi:hypothetical protein